MNPEDLLRLTLETVSTQKLRSFLTLLGIVIGISSVVLLSSFGEGTRRGVAAEFTQFGTTLVSVLPGKQDSFGAGPGYLGGTKHRLTLEDARALERVPGVRWVDPTVLGSGPVSAGERKRDTYIYGTVHEGQFVWQWPPRIGTFLPPGDWEHIPPVCVLGPKTAAELFPGENPLGRHIRIVNARFVVVGVMTPKGSLLGFDLDDAVYIPLVRAMRLFNRERVDQIYLFVENLSRMDQVVRDARALLRDRHGGEEDVTVTSQTQMLSVIDEVMSVLTVGVVAIAAISLFVGAMGILTIQWISMKERTQEIGLIKALGAGRPQILSMFLAESTALAVLGGIGGILVAEGIAYAIRSVLPAVPLAAPPEIYPLALGTSAVVGILAGILPALRAARVDPVDALRSE